MNMDTSRSVCNEELFWKKESIINNNKMHKTMNYNIVFCCTGNGLPFGETVLKQLLKEANIKNVDVWSCSTLDWGVNPRDAQMVQTTMEMGYTMEGTTKHMCRDDLMKADKIIVFEHHHRDEITRILDYSNWDRITLFDMYALGLNCEVRDPNYESPAIGSRTYQGRLQGDCLKVMCYYSNRPEFVRLTYLLNYI